MTDSIVLSDVPRGYVRSDSLQQEFDEAAERLRELDGWPNPSNGGRRELRADLALEGGGVRGIALVGAVLALDEAGYRFQRVAGTSAGAITAAIIAGIAQTGHDMTMLLSSLRSLDVRKFMPEGKLHQAFDRRIGHFAKIVTDATILTNREGLYSCDYLEEWLGPIMHEQLGIKTFADLRLSDDFDPELKVPGNQQYRLVVFATDLTRSRLARLPWDYSAYGVEIDGQDPVEAVRASMSIPFLFEPVHFQAYDTTVEVETSGGTMTPVRYPAGPHTWVDGALLARFPIHSFDRVDGRPPRWPTIGIKLSQFRTDYQTSEYRESAIAIAVQCLKTMMSEWDVVAPHETTAGRTIFINNEGLNAMNFDITELEQERLFLNGVEAATRFVIDATRQGGVPRR